MVAAILAPYFGAKKDKTMLGHYGRIKPGKDGLIRTELSPHRVETGRLASSESIYDYASTNLQNIPKKVAYEDPLYAIRECFVPDMLGTWLFADYTGAEALLNAAFSRNWEEFDLLMSGADVHKRMASLMFEVEEGDVTDAQRHVAKTIRYASQYLAGAPKVVESVNKDAHITGITLTMERGEELHGRFLDLSGLRTYWDEVEEELVDGGGWITNPLGFRRQFTNPDSYERLKEAVNFKPQSTVASCINRALIRIDDEVDRNGWAELRMQVHDEIIMWVRDALIDEVAAHVKECMESPLTINGRDIYIPVDIETGNDWWNKQKLVV